MALLMDVGSEPQTNEEIADLEAIYAIKHSAAVELKEQGNEFVKKGKKHYSEAINCYTRAINQKALPDADTSLIYSNRAHVNLLLGNYKRALEDSEQAVKLSPTNVKAHYRAVKASLCLDQLDEAKSYCDNGLQISPDNEELKKLANQISKKKLERELHETEVANAVKSAKSIVSAFEDRGIKVGKAMYQELTGVKKPTFDKSNILHWPVLLLYAEVMSSDIIEDFCETDMFSFHLNMMFTDTSPPLPWDTQNTYTRGSLELYYEANSGVSMSKKEIMHYLLDGTTASHLEEYAMEEIGDTNRSAYDNAKWVRVNERKTLHSILTSPDFIVPAIPVFYVISRRSSFYKDFKSGKWAPPRM